jgi:glutamyl-tRNA synthetase
VVDDVVHGAVEFQNTELDDLIIQRSDGNPTYNFCVVVDDFDMRITHVIRGDDHLNNTPRQINMLRALGAEPPVYAHVPMILGPDGSKLSKRHGAVSVLQYKELGFLPDALLNYLVRLGWSHGDQEIFSLEELTRVFDLRDLNRSASAINPDKLAWINQQHLMRADGTRLAAELDWHLRSLDVDTTTGPSLAAVAETLRERSKTLAEMAQGAVFFYREPAWFEEKAARKFLTPEARPMLVDLRHSLGTLAEWTAEAIHELLLQLAQERGVALGKVAQPVRVAVSGGSVSPPIDQTLAVLGREATLRRLERAIAYIPA